MGLYDCSMEDADGVKHPRVEPVWPTCGDSHRILSTRNALPHGTPLSEVCHRQMIVAGFEAGNT